MVDGPMDQRDTGKAQDGQGMMGPDPGIAAPLPG